MPVRFNDVILEFLDHIYGRPQVLVSQSLPPMRGQLPSRADHVPDLAAIELLDRQNAHLASKLLRVDPCACTSFVGAGVVLLEIVDKVVPDLEATLEVQLRVVNGKLNP